MRILITRPRDQAEEMAAELESLGHEVIVSPLLERQILEISDNLHGAGALVFTSLNGVAALKGRIPEALYAVPVFAIGERTAAAAEEAGFKNLIVGPGQARGLLPLIIGFKGKIAGSIVHISGQHVRTDMAALLNAAGRPAERLTAYRMVAQSGLSHKAAAALREGKVEVVLFFSPRSAKLFVTLMQAEGLAAGFERVIAVALSDAVAEPLNRLQWAEIRTAARPDRRAMLELLEGKEKNRRLAP